MNQALHIFSKDVRRLWIPLSTMLALHVLFTFFEMRPQHGGPMSFAAGALGAEQLVDLLLPIAWWFVIIQLVHEESIPGDRQFWITRPYWRGSLLGAKVLFILAFVNVPILIADCFILTAQGFSAAGHWQGVLWRQIPFTVAVLLPPLALGSSTRNLSQVIVAILLVVLRIVVGSLAPGASSGGSNSVDWIEATVDTIVFLAILCAVVLIQYGSRRTWLARGLLAAFVIVPGFSLPLRWQLDLQARVKPPPIDTAAVHIVFDPTRSRRTPLVRQRGFTQASVALPVAVSGAPDGVELVSNQASVNLGGKSFVEGASLERDKEGYWETILLEANLFSSLRNAPVTIRITPVVTAVRITDFRAPLAAGPVLAPGVGFCESSQPGPQFLNVDCRWALRSPLRTRVHADYPGWDTPDPMGRRHDQMTGDLSDSPFPAGLSLSPVHTQQVFSLAGYDLVAAMNYPGTQLVFETEHPIAHFQTQIELTGVRLEDFAVSAPER
jgi:hypothetical protein